MLVALFFYFWFVNFPWRLYLLFLPVHNYKSFINRFLSPSLPSSPSSHTRSLSLPLFFRITSGSTLVLSPTSVSIAMRSSRARCNSRDTSVPGRQAGDAVGIGAQAAVITNEPVRARCLWKSAVQHAPLRRQSTKMTHQTIHLRRRRQTHLRNKPKMRKTSANWALILRELQNFIPKDGRKKDRKRTSCIEVAWSPVRHVLDFVSCSS